MKSISSINGQRFVALMRKEVIQLLRDRRALAFMFGLPLIQLFLFGFAINADPRHLPTLVEMGDNGPLTRAVIAGMQQSDYFDFRGQVTGTAAGEEAHDDADDERVQDEHQATCDPTDTDR